MEDTIGLGFDSQHQNNAGNTGTSSAFVSSSTRQPYIQQHQYHHNMHPSVQTPAHPSTVSQQTALYNSQPRHVQMQQQIQWQQQTQQMQPTIQPPAFPPPPAQPSSQSLHFPPPYPIQPPLPPFHSVQTNTSSLPQHQIPSFQPPPGLPPGAPPSFSQPPAATRNIVPPTLQIPMPSSIPPSFLPPPTVAPVMPTTQGIPAQAPAEISHYQIQPSQPSQHQIVPAQIMQQPQHTDAAEKARSIAMRFQQESQHQATTEQTQQQAQHSDEAAEKARAIAMRFHLESKPIIDDNTIDKSLPYAELRRTHFEKERKKLQTFHLKNLEYVMKHEEKELRHHVDCMNQMTAYEEKQQIQYQLAQEQHRQRQMQIEHKKQQREQSGVLNDGGGGIGTKEQQLAERVRKRQHLGHASGGGSSKTNGSNRDDSTLKMRTSLYLTNLPTDGTTTERTLQSLFCAYGRLDRVTMYRNRSTGELKGDGIIVFGRDAVEKYQAMNVQEQGGADLVEAVCTQVNGAELPCGSILGVQPADMSYKKNLNFGQSITQQNTGRIGETNVDSEESAPKDTTVKNEATSVEVSEVKDAKVDDDLDDFFASLE